MLNELPVVYVEPNELPHIVADPGACVPYLNICFLS